MIVYNFLIFYFLNTKGRTIKEKISIQLNKDKNNVNDINYKKCL